MLPEQRILGGLAILAIGAAIVFGLQMFEIGTYVLAGLVGLVLVWMLGGMLYGIGSSLIGWVRELFGRR